MSAANSELKVEGFSNGPLQIPGSVSFNSPLKAALKHSFGKGENTGDFAMPGTALLPVPTPSTSLFSIVPACLSCPRTRQKRHSCGWWVVPAHRVRQKQDLPRGRERAVTTFFGGRGVLWLENYFKILRNQRDYRGVYMAKILVFMCLLAIYPLWSHVCSVFCLFLKIELFSYNLGFFLFKDTFWIQFIK